MAQRAQLTTVTAESGAGKSYLRCARFLVDEFLPHEEGVSYSNFPINIEAIADHFEGKIERSEIERRIQIIPEEILKHWSDGLSGPWDYFKDVDLAGAHIQIDEAHVYIDKTQLKNWQSWFGAVRHQGGTAELISQAIGKIPKEIRDEAGMKIVLVDSKTMRDPLLGCQLGDWYEMRAMMTGKYRAYFVEQEYKRYGETWKAESKRWHIRNPYYYQFYDSYNAIGEIARGSKAQKQEYEKRTVPGMVFWFVRRNVLSLSLRLSVASVCIWFVLCGIPMASDALKSFVVRPETKQEKVAKKEHPKVIHSTYVPDKNDQLKMLQAEIVELKKVNQQLMHDQSVTNSMYEGLLDRILNVKKSNDQIGMIFPDKAVTKGGRIVRTGEKLHTYEGEKTIKGINYNESKIDFTDGSDGWVTIGQRRVSTAYETAIFPSDVEADERTRQRGQATAGFKTRVNSPESDVPRRRSAVNQRDLNSGSGLRNHNRSR